MVESIILRKSYEIVYLMFICITAFLYIRSINIDLTPKQIISLQLAGLVTSIAAFHYYYMIQSKNTPVLYRYFDWFFTTPILLIDLCILLDVYDFNSLLNIVSLNTIMLIIGYLGELNILSIISSTILGFIPFVIMFYMIYLKKEERIKELKNEREKNEKENKGNLILSPDNKSTLFNVFLVLWSLYGINHMLPQQNLKNIFYNILDLITKGFFGLFVYWSVL